MGCQFWLNENGQLIMEDGNIVYSEDCPCGGDNCCEKLADQIASILRQTTQLCVPCDQLSWNENCGECEIPDPNPDPENPMTQLGEYVTRRKNRIISFSCNTGFTLQATEQPPQDGDIVTVSFCDGYTATTSYSTAPSLTCLTEEPCCIFVHVYCQQGSTGSEKLYPILSAPDYPSTFGSAQNICEQHYWQTCFDPTPVGYVTCAAQVIAPRCWFDDYDQGTAPEPDYTMVWGVLGCFCEGKGKWKIRSIHGGSAGLIVVNSPFTADHEQLTDDQGNVKYDDNHNPIMVVKCAITCAGAKGMVEEMTSHYQYNSNGSKNVVFATVDTTEWQDWTGETISSACFWGYIPLSAVYGYKCHAYGSQAYKWHYIAFDCFCNMKQIEGDSSSTMDMKSAGLYEVVGDKDLCTIECAVLWALMSYAKGEGMDASQASTNANDPRTTGDGGVILQEDSRAPSSGIYSIGGSPCIYATWDGSDKKIFIWIDCDCGLHVNCMTYPTSYKFLKSVDPCICVDFRELVAANPTLFGVVDTQWGSHSIVHWEHTTPSHSYTGPYWDYYGTSNQYSMACSKCDVGQDGVSVSWYAVSDPFIDYNMLIAYRIVNGEHEFGHVNKSGGISNYRLQASGAQTTGLVTASFGYTNPWGETQYYAFTTDGKDASYYCNSLTGGLIGYYYCSTVYNAYCAPSGSLECPCEDYQYDPLPICQDHSRERSIESIFCNAADRGSNIRSNGEMACFRGGSVKTHHPGHNVYVTNQTTCEDICVSWEPGYYTWSVFEGEFINTSCGLLFHSCDGAANNHIQNVSVLGSSTIENTWAPKIQATYGWYDSMYVTGGYPSSNLTISGGYFVETRNSRGTLISYQSFFMPSGYTVHDVQPPKCHEANCTGKVVYADITAFCQSNPNSGSCECYNNTSGADCIDPSIVSN